MVYERTGYAPWSLTREAGVQSATVDGTIQVPQYVYPNLDTGFLDEKGNWKGRKSTDEVFFVDAPHVNIPNGTAILSPQTADRDFINMTGYTNLVIGIKVTNTGNFLMQAVMGPDTNAFANLTPVNAASLLQGTPDAAGGGGLENLFSETTSLTADVWNIFTLQLGRLQAQKNMQFKINNQSGGNSDITFAYLRVV
tara:strand:+ start:158 stop:745 length:588 start_codon:yes stop_codon:yes gene_type:complete